MNESHFRLQQARKKAGFETASDAARSFGWNENTYRSHENGERGLKAIVASRYANAFKVSFSWLMSGEGKQTDENTLVITGWIEEKGVILLNNAKETDDRICLSFRCAMTSLCFYVKTDAFYPRYQKGDIVICDFLQDNLLWLRENNNPKPILEGVVKTKDGVTYFGWYYPDGSDPRLEVIGAKPLRGFISEAFLPVLAVVRLGTYSARRFTAEIA